MQLLQNEFLLGYAGVQLCISVTNAHGSKAARCRNHRILGWQSSSVVACHYVSWRDQWDCGVDSGKHKRKIRGFSAHSAVDARVVDIQPEELLLA
jgi:hypothetical protein